MKAKLHSKIKAYPVLGQEELLPQSALLRFVKTEQGEIYFDASSKLDLPAVYIKKDKRSLEEALSSGSIAKALEAKMHPDVHQQIIKHYQLKFAQAVHLSRKSGLLLVGFDQVISGKNIGIAVDQNISERSKKDLEQKADKLNCPLYVLEKGQLEQILNIENAKVIGLLKGTNYVLDCLAENQALGVLVQN